MNALTGHRSCAPEDYGRYLATLPQGPAPVSGIFPAGVAFAPSGDWASGNPAFTNIARISRRTVPDAWARPPVSWHAVFPGLILSDPGRVRFFKGCDLVPGVIADGVRCGGSGLSGLFRLSLRVIGAVQRGWRRVAVGGPEAVPGCRVRGVAVRFRDRGGK